MGNFLYGGKRPTSITYQGKDVQTLKYNGVVVWENVPTNVTSYSADNSGYSGTGMQTNKEYVVPTGVNVIRYYGEGGIDGKKTESKEMYIKVKAGQKIKVTSLVKYGTVYPQFVSEAEVQFGVGLSGAPIVAMSRHDTKHVYATVNIYCSPEINKHNFNDSTSDHKHLDWTK